MSWTPAEATTRLWYANNDTATISDTAGSVTQVDDLSGNDDHATQTDPTKQPVTGTRTISGLNALDFNGTSHTLDFPAVDMVGHEWFAVISQDFPGGDEQIFSSSSNRQLRMEDGAVSATGASFPYASSLTMTPTLPATTAGMVEYLMRDPFIIGLDGTRETGSAQTSTGYDLNRIGVRSTNSNAFNGLIGEIIVMPVSDDATTLKVEGYLAHKWGIEGSLPAAHPYKAAPPVTGTPTPSPTPTPTPVPVISSVTDTKAGESVTVTLAADVALTTLTYNGNSETFSQSGTAVTVTAPLGGQAFGSLNDWVASTATDDSAAVSKEFLPETGKTYAAFDRDYASLTSDSAFFGSGLTAISTGDQVAFTETITVSSTDYTVEMDGNGEFYATGAPDGTYTLDYRILDLDDGYSAGTASTINMTIAGAPTPSPTPTPTPTPTPGGIISIVNNLIKEISKEISKDIT